MGRRRRQCLQPYFVWLGCVALWAQGTAGQPQPPPPKPPRPQPLVQQVRPATASSEGGFAVPEYREEGAVAASRVRRRGQQDVLRGYVRRRDGENLGLAAFHPPPSRNLGWRRQPRPPPRDPQDSRERLPLFLR